MQITRISLYLTEIPYRNAYKTATNTTKNGRHILCKIETDSGITGWGETGIISQRYPSQGDSPEAMFAVLQHYLAPAIIGMDPTAIETVIWALERVLKGNYFAKTAIDHAIYDITGKAFGVSVAKLLGGMHRSTFAVTRSLPLGTPEEVADRAKKMVDDGYTMLTLKGGKDYQNDIRSFAKTRRAVGDAFPLEIDPNCGYDRASAFRATRAMEEYGLEAIEQPLSAFDLQGMQELRSRVNTPIIADESVFTIQDLMAVIQAKAADVICLKPFKSGGIFLSKKMQWIAEAHNLSVSTGSMHPFGIGTAALHQFVCTIANLVAAGYGAPEERFVDDIVDDSCFTFKNGHVSLIEKPGLGIVVNEDKVKKYSKKEVCIDESKPH